MIILFHTNPSLSVEVVSRYARGPFLWVIQLARDDLWCHFSDSSRGGPSPKKTINFTFTMK